MPDYHDKTIFQGLAIVPFSADAGGWMLPGNRVTAFRHVAELCAVEMDRIMREAERDRPVVSVARLAA